MAVTKRLAAYAALEPVPTMIAGVYGMNLAHIPFNFLVSRNTRAVNLWQRRGFTIVGTVPQAFHRQVHGFVDTYVTYRRLEP
jgi:hypothetical protein